MKPIPKHFLITLLISVGAGIGATSIVASSENGYVAGFVFFPLFILIAIATLILVIVGAIAFVFGSKAGPWLLLAALLLPGSFIVSALVAKQLELGAYREDPMVPMTQALGNIVLFQEGTTEEQINSFWNETLSTERGDGRGHSHLPGLRGVGRFPDKEGLKVIEFDFFDNATNEQREFVYSKVRSSPVVFKLMENIPTKDFKPPATPESTPNYQTKKVVVIDSTNSK